MCPTTHSCLDLKFPFKPPRIRKENTGLSHFKFVEDALVGFAAGHFGYWLNWVWNPSDSWAHCFL